MESSPRPRAVKACVICHKKKIKCDLGRTNGNRCSPCIRDDYECRPRERKRKRTYTLDSESPPPKGTRDSTLLSPNSGASRDAATAFRPGPSGANNGTNSFAQPSNADFTGFRNNRNHSLVPEAIVTDQTIISSSGKSVTRRYSTSYTPTNVSYLERSKYIGDNVAIDDAEEAPPHSTRDLNENDMQILHMQNAFVLPARSVRDSLLDSFWSRCWPWTPIVERGWIEGRPQNEASILLLQGMMLAGSRVSSSPITGGEPEEYYNKGKTLFWMGAEKDPLIMTVAALLLNWWNPEGPEHFSIDTSAFWLRISVGLAYQVGLHRDPEGKPDAALRRKLWWSLVTRDCLINSGHGRPRAINLQLTDVLPPSVQDFEGDQDSANLFSAYVGISLILGDLTQCFLQRGRFREKRLMLGDKVFRWIQTLPNSLQLCYNSPGRLLKAYSFEARQLHVQYFTVLTILNKRLPPTTTPSTASLLASSFVAGIFEDFLARDELRYLGPIFTFYLLAAGVSLLSSYRYAGLWHLAEQDLQIIIQAQQELGKRWPSAVGSLKRMTDVRDKVTHCQRSTYFPENNLTPEQMQYFNSFGPDLCRSWDVLHVGGNNTLQPATRDLMTAGILQDLRTPGALYPDQTQDPAGVLDGHGGTPLDPSLLNGQITLDQYGGIGNWLFNDWEIQGGALW
ncbi:hypothetical protein EJ08DRAFT_703357 [Tothia fuscella]|uniref:Zn(2)-C6 fungal-type domain-containing protein n=1 Tax=Tothia fuscella TaxID=1048955 RepID=A0A9P4TS91_9PEZI|nr:hypothetical protein EJ08DRAFT_703357 [Tothia fuscella]